MIAGNVDPQTALREATSAFGSVPKRDLPRHPDISLTPARAQSLTLPTNFPVGLATLAYRMPGLHDKDYAAAEILSDIMGSQRGALYGMVPAGHALMSEFAFEPKASAGYGVAVAAFPKGGDPARFCRNAQHPGGHREKRRESCPAGGRPPRRAGAAGLKTNGIRLAEAGARLWPFRG